MPLSTFPIDGPEGVTMQDFQWWWILVALLALGSGVGFGLWPLRIVWQNQRAVVYRLGRVSGSPREPGLRIIIPFIDRIAKVNISERPLKLPKQDILTSDGVSLRVHASIFYLVVDPILALVNVRGYENAISQRGQIVLRQVVGARTLQQMLSDPAGAAAEVATALAEVSASWGLKVNSAGIRDVELDEDLEIAMAAKASAVRHGEAQVAIAEGERNSATLLAQAATILGDGPALRLRALLALQTAAESGAVVVMDTQGGSVAAQSAAGQLAATKVLEPGPDAD